MKKRQAAAHRCSLSGHVDGGRSITQERIVVKMFEGEEKLRQRASKPIPMHVEEVAPGVSCFRNFGTSNAILIKGAGEAVVIDALESDGYAKEARAYIDRPVKTLIYTHSHGDHTGGAVVLGAEAERIIAREEHALGRAELLVNCDLVRKIKQFGMGLTPEDIISLGIAPLMPAKGERGFLEPTLILHEEEYVLYSADREIVLIAAPGETDDTQYVWLPKERILCCGDNFYDSFPNLYSLKGTPYRDVDNWVRALDKILELMPDILIPGHGDVLRGWENIQAVISPYREALTYVLEQTLQKMNQGHTMQRIVDEVKLPPHLAGNPYLQEFYGTVEWSVRSIYTGYYGWFDGNPVRLSSLPEDVQAKNYVDLAGGAEQMLSAARKAHDAGDYQWSAELCDHLQRAGLADEKTLRLQADNFTRLGRQQISANGRHFYLMSAKELLDKLEQ